MQITISNKVSILTTNPCSHWNYCSVDGFPWASCRELLFVILAVLHIGNNPKSACNEQGIVCKVSQCYTSWGIVSSLTNSYKLNQNLNNYINIKYVFFHILKAKLVWLKRRWRYRVWVIVNITRGTVDVITYQCPSLGWYQSVKGTMALFVTLYLICKVAIFNASDWTSHIFAFISTKWCAQSTALWKTKQTMEIKLNNIKITIFFITGC